jgi:DNA mismatch repair protein MutS2
MDERTLKALEWDRVLMLLSLCASTDEGRRLAAGLIPALEPKSVSLRQQRVKEFAEGETLCGRLSLEGYRRSETKAPEGVSLPVETLRNLRTNLRIYRAVLAWLQDPSCDRPALRQVAPSYAEAASLGALLERVFDDKGEIRDGASPELQRLRNEREGARSRVFSMMEEMAAKLGSAVLRQESCTVRNGRLVLSVQASRKSEVKGILHDSSSTGATAFIEPLEAVELNNRLSDLDALEREEIERILLEVSAKASASSAALEAIQTAIEEMDLIAACARFGRAVAGRFPESDSSGAIFKIVEGRHPLLDPRLNGLRARAWGEAERQNTVPLNLEMAYGKVRTLVVSGPNAGGKSVALKTAGLLCAMSQAGIPVPVAEGSVFPLFAFFYASVGDSQSILDSLSTFSARMVHLKEAIRDLGEPFLAILDELGSGTDPVEGAALGEAILAYLHGRRGYILCSTHQEALKARAWITPGMGNGCMEFSEGDLRPTFRLIMGRAGQSRALETAEAAGLPAEILAAARASMPKEERRLKEVIEALEAEKAALGAERAMAAEAQEAARGWQERLKGEMALVQEARKRFAEEELPRRIRKAEELFLGELKSEASRQAVRRVAKREAPRVIESAAREAGVAVSGARVWSAMPDKGDWVLVRAYGLKGKVTAVDPATMKLRVDVDGKTLQVGAADVEPISAGASGVPSHGGFAVNAKAASSEINLIGQTVEEAVQALDSFLDRATMESLGHVRVIHGIGTGRLRTGIHAYLKKSPYVKSYEEAPPSMGGAGATLVTLRDG